MLLATHHDEPGAQPTHARRIRMRMLPLWRQRPAARGVQRSKSWAAGVVDVEISQHCGVVGLMETDPELGTPVGHPGSRADG